VRKKEEIRRLLGPRGRCCWGREVGGRGGGGEECWGKRRALEEEESKGYRFGCEGIGSNDAQEKGKSGRATPKINQKRTREASTDCLPCSPVHRPIR